MAYERRIVHLDTDGVTEKQVLSGTALSDPRAVSAWFELLRIGGCGAGGLELQDKFTLRDDIGVGDHIAFEYSSGSRWYLGRVEDVEEVSPKGVSVNLYGLWATLNEVFPGGFAGQNLGKPHRYARSDWFPNDPDYSYQSVDSVNGPADVVHLLWQQYINPTTNICLSTVETPPDVTLDGFVLRGQETVAELLRSLAMIGRNASVGVDANGCLFYIQKRSTTIATFQEGVDLESLRRKRDRSLMFNRIIFTGGYIYGVEGGAGFYRYEGNFIDSNSIDLNGERALRLFVPWIRRDDDVLEFAKWFFQTYGSPTTRYPIQTEPQTALLKPWDGRIRLLAADGSTLTTDVFDRVKVTFDHKPVFELTVGPEDIQFPPTPEPARYEVGPGDPNKKGDGQPAPGGSVEVPSSFSGTQPSSASDPPGTNLAGNFCPCGSPSAWWVARAGSGTWLRTDQSAEPVTDCAEITLAAGATGKQLVARGFGFTEDEIPDSSTIKGIVAQVWVKANASGGGEDFHESKLQLVKDGFSPVGSNKAGTGGASTWPTSTELLEFGSGGTDLWGTTWTPAEIRDPNFGILIEPINAGASANTGYVCQIHLCVCTTESATSSASPGSASQSQGTNESQTNTNSSGGGSGSGSGSPASGSGGGSQASSSQSSAGGGGGSGSASASSSSASSSSSQLLNVNDCGCAEFPTTVYVIDIGDGDATLATLTYNSGTGRWEGSGGGCNWEFWCEYDEGLEMWTRKLSDGSTTGEDTATSNCTGTLTGQLGGFSCGVGDWEVRDSG